MEEKVMAANVKQITLDIAAPADWDGERFIKELLESRGLSLLGSNQEDLTEVYTKTCGFGKDIKEFELKEFADKEGAMVGKIKVPGVSIVNSEGYDRGNESYVNVYSSVRECIDLSYQTYLDTWNNLLKQDEDGLINDNGNSFLSKEEYGKKLLQNGYVLIQMYDYHIQFEYFEKELELNKELFISNSKEMDNKKELSVNTPLGDIVVAVKTDSEYPGVYVDLKGEKVKDTFEVGTVSLATVEFAPNKNKVQTVVYGDAEKEEPTYIVEHENVEKVSLRVIDMSHKNIESYVYEWLNKMTEELDVNSPEYKEAESLIEDLCAREFPELHDCLFGDSDPDLIFTDIHGGFKVFYYNPDADAGGQIVEGRFEESDISRLLGGEEMVEVIAHYTQYLSDINSHHFFDTVFELLDLKEKGRFLGTDIGEVCRNYLNSKDVGFKSLDEKMVEAKTQTKRFSRENTFKGRE